MLMTQLRGEIAAELRQMHRQELNNFSLQKLGDGSRYMYNLVLCYFGGDTQLKHFCLQDIQDWAVVGGAQSWRHWTVLLDHPQFAVIYPILFNNMP